MVFAILRIDLSNVAVSPFNSLTVHRHPSTTMDKSDDIEPGSAFAKLVSADNYNEWAREVRYFLESVWLWVRLNVQGVCSRS